MKKILVVITTGLYQYGGLSIVALNYLSEMNRENLQIDFASDNEISEEIKETLKRFNCKYYRLPSRKKKTICYIVKLKIICESDKYDVIHIHGNSSTMLIELVAAYFGKIKKRIVHCHTTHSNYPILNYILRPLFKILYTDAIATSQKAGEWLFTNNFIVLNNAVNLDKYKFSSTNRKMLRKELGVSDKFVIGTVGKLNAGKNYRFMLDIFSTFYNLNPNSVLLIVGGGPEEIQLKEKAKQLKIDKVVLFVGMQDHVEKFYSAMDFFLFTSLYEGLGMVLIEAQISGVEVLSSNTVPPETKITNRISYLGLDASIFEWANEIYDNNPKLDRNLTKTEVEVINELGFNIKCEANKLRNIYMR